jgi:hypothetical protein
MSKRSSIVERGGLLRGGSGAAGLGEAAQPVTEPVGAVRDVDAGWDAAVVQLAESLGSYSEELLDRHRPMSQEKRLAESGVVSGHRPRVRQTDRC